MTRILVYGLCPLPFENTRKSYGPGIRSWQFAWSLAQAGHEVKLAAMKIPDVYERGEAVATETRDGVEIVRLGDVGFMDPTQVRKTALDWRAEALVGATIYGSSALAGAGLPLPLWADQFGHVMAEAQAKAALEGSNWPLAYFWKLVEPVMLRADKLSTVSERQQYAAIGELGAVGRLNAETCGYPFISVMPCALVPEIGEAEPRPVLKGVRVPEDAFLVLWSGGFNVWSDVETLFRGVEKAMTAIPEIYFVSTGGGIDGHDIRTYAHFQELVAASPLASRFFLEGWLPAEEIPSYVAEADLGVLTERSIYEGVLGSKNRIIQWMGAGLPVAYNRVGDLGHLLEREDLGLVFEPEDSGALGEKILWAVENRDVLRRMAGKARAAALERFSFSETTADLQLWADRPARAPDAEVMDSLQGPRDHGDRRQRVAERAASVSALRRSGVVRALWRRYFSRR